MSNYYFRDVHGNWFISNKRKLTPVADNLSMGMAYLQGKVDARKEILEDRKNDTLLARSTQVGTMDTSSALRE